MLGMPPLRVALFLQPFIDLTLLWGVMEDGMQVDHHHNPDFKNIEHYIDDISKHNAIGLFQHYTKQLLQNHDNFSNCKFSTANNL